MLQGHRKVVQRCNAYIGAQASEDSSEHSVAKLATLYW
jgi:hypothetical protein